MHALFNAGYCSLSTKISQPASISYEVTETQVIKYGRQKQWTQQMFYSVDFLEMHPVFELQLSHCTSTEES